jgi:hypothetical protein
MMAAVAGGCSEMSSPAGSYKGPLDSVRIASRHFDVRTQLDVAISGIVALRTTAYDSGLAVSAAPLAQWSSSDERVATITQNGVLRGIALGTARISAAIGTHADTGIVHVYQAESFQIQPLTRTVVVGDTVAVVAAPFTSLGVQLQGIPVTWSSSVGAVASVDSLGILTASSAGSTRITATFATPTNGVRTDTATITVGSPRGTRVRINPVNAPVATRSIAIGGTIRGQFDSKANAPYSFAVFLDGVKETAAAPNAYVVDAPYIFVRKAADGIHTIVVRVTDANGLADSAVTQIETRVPDAMYIATILPLPTGDVSATATAINQSGTVLGTGVGADGRRHLITWRQGVPSVIARSDTASIVAAAINDNGDVVGTMITPGRYNDCFRGFIQLAGRAPSITEVAYPCITFGTDINNGGSIVLGGVNGGSGVLENGAFTLFGRTSLSSINGLGAAAGRTFGVYGGTYAAYYRVPGRPAPIDAAPLVGAMSAQSSQPVSDGGAEAINNRMSSVEWYNPPSSGPTSWNLRHGDGTVASLRPGLAGYNTGFSFAALTNDDVVLAFDAATTSWFLWSNGAVSRVHVVTPGMTITSLGRMNDAKQIVGAARLDGQVGTNPVLLTPSP